MVWDGLKKRASDSGQEDPTVILARIDERLKNHIESFKVHEQDFKDHKDDDRKNFSVLNRAYWMSAGAFGFLMFILKVLGK